MCPAECRIQFPFLRCPSLGAGFQKVGMHMRRYVADEKQAVGVTSRSVGLSTQYPREVQAEGAALHKQRPRVQAHFGQAGVVPLAIEPISSLALHRLAHKAVRPRLQRPGTASPWTCVDQRWKTCVPCRFQYASSYHQKLKRNTRPVCDPCRAYAT